MSVDMLPRPDLSTQTDTGEVDHMICPGCYPDYVPGRQVVAWCGSLTEDSLDVLDRPEDCPSLCVVCADLFWLPVCARCGARRT